MIVIKYGGHALPDPGSVDPALELIAQEHREGKKIVLVHGGGPQINAALAVRGLGKEMVGGYRKTSPEVFAVVQEVLSGQVLRSIVNQLIHLGVNAVGLSAADGETIRAEKMHVEVDGTLTDIGLVGDVKNSNPALLKQLLADGYLPVISPIGVDTNGQGLNLNADLVAGVIGGALGAERVLYMTDVSGIYRNWPDANSKIDSICVDELRSLAPLFSEGMVPKVKSAINAIESGAQAVRIFDGRNISELRAALADSGGTLVVP